MKSKLDQFYTKEDVANDCVIQFNEVTKSFFKSEDSIIVEPSAGTGSFLKAIQKNLVVKQVKAYDLEPKHAGIVEQDYLKLKTCEFDNENVAIVGNPPFGKRSKLAIDFFNKSAEYADIVAFIVPIQFQKYSVQSKLNKDFKLISNTVLDEKAFVFNEKEYAVRCVFQIWTRLDTKYPNQRIIERPAVSHPDFDMYQHNNTKESLKYFEYDWDFAVHRQGYYDYLEKIYDKTDLKVNKQYIFFKAKNEQVLQNLKQLDFKELSKLNTTTPGFGKADVVRMYSEVF